jgi:predicted SnoaL-like aldol condensation-catalyzing enzyme
MPTPEQNKETVATFAREVFGSKNLEHADARLADDFVEHQVFPHWGVVDTIGTMGQLGLLPAPDQAPA